MRYSEEQLRELWETREIDHTMLFSEQPHHYADVEEPWELPKEVWLLPPEELFKMPWIIDFQITNHYRGHEIAELQVDYSDLCIRLPLDHDYDTPIVLSSIDSSSYTEGLMRLNQDVYFYTSRTDKFTDWYEPWMLTDVPRLNEVSALMFMERLKETM